MKTYEELEQENRKLRSILEYIWEKRLIPGETIDVDNIFLLRAGDIIQNSNGKYMVLGIHSICRDVEDCLFSTPERLDDQFGPYVYVCRVAEELVRYIKNWEKED